MTNTISILVKGKVQGVFYRQSTREQAINLGLTGEVKNNKDGSVSIIATGSPGNLEKLVEWCKRGPSRAIVNEVTVEYLPERSFDSFNVIR